MDLIDQIPGYADAIEKETNSRDAAFLSVTENIGGFEVMPMTLRHYLILRMAKSPLLHGGTPSPVELTAFLWLLSTEYTPVGKWRRFQFVRRCRKFCPPRRPLFETRGAMNRWNKKCATAMARAADIVIAAREYVDAAFVDKPTGKGGNDVAFYSDACALCASFAEDFGWSQETVLNLPLKVLFQYLKERKERIYAKNGKQALLFNPSDSIRSKWLLKINEEARN